MKLYRIVDAQGAVRFYTDWIPLEEEEAKELCNISYKQWFERSPEHYPFTLVEVSE